MADLHLQIALHQTMEVYRPGDELRGTVTITSTGGQEDVKKAELMVFWRTSGIGTRDEAVIHRDVMVSEETKLPASFIREIAVTLPQQPWTYAGRLIKIDWYVGLYVNKGWKKRQETEVGFQIRPEGMPPVIELSVRDTDRRQSDLNQKIYYNEHGRPVPPPRDI